MNQMVEYFTKKSDSLKDEDWLSEIERQKEDPPFVAARRKRSDIEKALDIFYMLQTLPPNPTWNDVYCVNGITMGRHLKYGWIFGADVTDLGTPIQKDARFDLQNVLNLLQVM